MGAVALTFSTPIPAVWEMELAEVLEWAGEAVALTALGGDVLLIERDHHGRITRIEIDPLAFIPLAGIVIPLLIAAAVVLAASC